MPRHPTSENYVRLSCRVRAQIKSRAEEAAALLGQSITDFTESALADKAQAVIESHSRISLSERDFKHFVAVLSKRKKPTKALRDAVSEFRKLHSTDADADL